MGVPSKTTFLIVRHGETLWNVERRFQGHEDSPLTDRGKAQADALGARLERMNFDALVSSDLGRARETADIIARRSGLSSYETDSRLRERHYGMMEGLRIMEVRAKQPGLFAAWNADDPDFVIPGGESHRQHYERNAAFIQEWDGARPGTVTVVVAHGGVMDSVFRFVTGAQLAQPRCFVTTNASLSVICHGLFYGTKRWVIQAWNDTGHLNDIGFDAGLG
jgi:probable phosphoglycerate mutase